MSKGVIAVIVGAIVLLGGLAFVNKSGQPAAPALTFTGLQQQMANGAKLYDVRTAPEYASGHFTGAINWPVENIAAGQLPDVPKTTKLYVYCESGSRSTQAMGLLKNAGFTDVTNLGGLARIQSIGGTLVK